MLPCARTEDLLIEELPNELVVYDRIRHRAHNLNRTAALVWKQCDGKTTVESIGARLRDELEAGMEDRLVWFALDDLGKAGLLRERIEVPENACRLSRRKITGQLALMGGVSLLLPVVISIVAPTPADATSGTRPQRDP
jgi:hypothetical protein